MTTHIAELSQKKLTLCLFGLVIVALLLRLPNLRESLWYDELWSTGIILSSFKEVMYAVIEDVHPPLYHLIMWVWIKLFGDSEISVRFLPLLAGLASIPLTYVVVKERCGTATGLIAAGLIALSPTHVWYSQEARAYSLLLMFVLSAVWSFDRACSSRRPSRWLALFTISCFSVVFLHYYAIAYIGLLGLLAFLRPAQARLMLISICTLTLMALGTFLIIKWHLFGQLTQLDHLREFRLFEVWILLFDWFPMGSVFSSGIDLWSHGFIDLFDRPGLLFIHTLLAFLFTWGVVRGIRTPGQLRKTGPLDLAVLVFAIPVLLAIMTLLGFERTTILRSHLSAMPYFFGVLAYGAVSIPSNTLRATAVASITALLLYAQTIYQLSDDVSTVYKPNPDWRATAKYIGSRMVESGAAIVTATPAIVLTYYDRRFQEQETSMSNVNLATKAKFPMYLVENPKRFELEGIQSPIVFIRDRNWQGKSDLLQSLIESAPEWRRIDSHFEKCLEIQIYERI